MGDWDADIEILKRPARHLDFYMERLTYLKPFRKACSWVTDQNITLYKIAKESEDFYLGKSKTRPKIFLSEACNPMRNDEDIDRNAARRMEYHAHMTGTYSHGHVPIDESLEMIESTGIVFKVLDDLNKDSSIQVALDAFYDYVAFWNYTGRPRMSQTEFQQGLRDKCNTFISLLKPVWVSFKHLEDRLSGAPTQMELCDLEEAEKHLSKASVSTAHVAHENIKLSKQILYHVTGQDVTQIPVDKRKLDSTKKKMVTLAIELLDSNPEMTDRSAAAAVIKKFKGTKGAYIDTETLRRQISRKKPY